MPEQKRRQDSDAKESRRVDSIMDIPPAQRNIQAVMEMEERAIHRLTTGERISNVIANSVGSMRFVVIHLIWFSAWIVPNLGVIRGITPFDPFPFSFLTLMVSLEAIFLSIFLLINQNAMSRQADKRGHLDLQVNLLAEQESTKLLQMMQKISSHLGIDDHGDGDAHELTKDTDLNGIVRELEEKLPDSGKGSAK